MASLSIYRNGRALKRLLVRLLPYRVYAALWRVKVNMQYKQAVRVRRLARDIRTWGNTHMKKISNILRRLMGKPAISEVEAASPSSAQVTLDPIDAMIPDYSLANYVGGGGAEQFKTIGRVMVEWFKQFSDLRPDERVLEVGCGIGRIAIPLTQYLDKGSYVGFDIVTEGIEWCQRKVTPRYPNFEFFVADVHNQYYHPEGTQAAAEYVFPFEDGSFDFVFLTSVFTHMLPVDLEHYTAEISRVLRPGGRCFCTAYVIDDVGRKQLDEQTSRMAFKAYPGGYWTITPDNPEHAVAYPEAYFNQVFVDHGLQPTRLISGEWWKHDFAQDILIVAKPAGNA
jgi:ubiquinone/menaquinone biosynthesis C-methylase UbiE